MIIIPRVLLKLNDCLVELEDRTTLEILIESAKKNLEYLVLKQMEIDMMSSGDGSDDGLLERTDSKHHIIDSKIPRMTTNYHQ